LSGEAELGWWFNGVPLADPDALQLRSSMPPFSWCLGNRSVEKQ
jgi:hypothetical protein